MLSRLLKLLVVLLAVIVALAGGAGYKLKSFGETPVDVPSEMIVEFPAGTPLIGLGQRLADKGVVSDAGLFYGWVRLFSSYQSFQAGTYRFEGKITPDDVARAMIKGDAYRPNVLSITIPEGFTLKQICERLAANGVGHIVEVTRLANDPAFAKSLNVPSKNLEGYLYPATYNFTEMPTAMQALTQMVKVFWEKLPKDYQKNIATRGLSLHEAVTFASLIELETLQDDEKPLISEVIWRRLKDGAPLAIDASVIYGVENYDGDLKTVHLKDATNPYNSRIHKGLPPTPIGAPATGSLAAVLTPSNLGYYYYVLIPGTQKHHFSKTLREHNLHVKKLVNASKKRQASEESNDK